MLHKWPKVILDLGHRVFFIVNFSKMILTQAESEIIFVKDSTPIFFSFFISEIKNAIFSISDFIQRQRQYFSFVIIKTPLLYVYIVYNKKRK